MGDFADQKDCNQRTGRTAFAVRSVADFTQNHAARRRKVPDLRKEKESLQFSGSTFRHQAFHLSKSSRFAEASDQRHRIPDSGKIPARRSRDHPLHIVPVFQ